MPYSARKGGFRICFQFSYKLSQFMTFSFEKYELKLLLIPVLPKKRKTVKKLTAASGKTLAYKTLEFFAKPFTLYSNLVLRKSRSKIQNSQMRTIFLLLDILDNKYLFYPSNYIQYQNLITSSRRKTTNPIKVIGISHIHEIFFFRESLQLFQLSLQAWHYRLQ